MRYRNPKKESDLFSMIDHQQSVIKSVKDVNKLNAMTTTILLILIVGTLAANFAQIHKQR